MIVSWITDVSRKNIDSQKYENSNGAHISELFESSHLWLLAYILRNTKVKVIHGNLALHATSAICSVKSSVSPSESSGGFVICCLRKIIINNTGIYIISF